MQTLTNLKGLHKIHFIGIGGAGMSPLAKMMLEHGYEVTGSDRENSEIIEGLEKLGAKVMLGGQKAENVRGKDAVVVSTAISFDNPEVLAAKDLGIRKLHRSDINAALVNAYKGIAVAGAHGKTTTTSMLGVALTHAGASPSVVVGGEMPDLGTNAVLGKSDYLVSEADESDGSFLKLHPFISVVTNVEDDHMDHYGTMENIIKAFHQFIENTRDGGWAVLCMDNENLRNIVKTIDKKYLTYAIDHAADYRAKDIAMEGTGIAFDVWHGSERLGHVALNIPGRHNVLDALACIVTGLSIGVPFEKLAAGLAAFHGAKRRFQTKGKEGGVWVVDDYAHHPTEIAATLKAAKETNPKRLICVFQPHRYSRTQLLYEEFGRAFISADVLFLTDVYAAGEAPIAGISGQTIESEVERQTAAKPIYVKKREDLAPTLKDFVQAGDLVITMGAGDIFKTGEELVHMLKG